MSQTTEARESFVRRLERELLRRTGGRVRGLDIREEEDQVHVSCTVPSFQVKLLVLLAVVGCLTPADERDVFLTVGVVGGPPLAEGSGGDGAWAGPLRSSRVSRR